ncbi:MAG: GNAT family N-acetyltransferase [Pseudomonadales bacterium]|jgi:ribosomal protein S18 acetylase RimI-like enzyme|tara:strand:+ start:751 stop:1224 length:474 start_codon:yes stop_codon:yes gene_type:complete
MITIRPATPVDIDAIARFNLAMALETEDKQLDAAVLHRGVTGMQQRPELGFYLVACLNDVAIGCLGVTFEWSDWRSGLFWWIQSVYVDPDHRGQGAFSGLFKETQRLAMAADEVIGIRLYAEQDNLRAIRTYHRLGMHTTDYRLLEIAVPVEGATPA